VTLLPDKVTLLPDKVTLLPDKVTLLPDKVTLLPDKVTLLPDKVTLFFKKELYSPKDTSHTLASKALGVGGVRGVGSFRISLIAC
jgi:hypothetical protein